MYQAHFGLNKGLFDGGIASEEIVFIGPRQELVVANFKVALTTLDSAIVLTGPAGVGKTTITSAALRAATTTRLALGWVGSAPANGPEMLEHLLAEFGFNPHRMGRVERLQAWRQFLNEMSATDSRVFVIAEHADEMERDVLRMLEGATAADANGCPGANLILLGQAELNELFKLPALASLKQRIRLRQKLEPFTIAELEAYLKHRVKLAGGSFEQVFERGAVAALHEYSAGIARVVNNLCETALTLAATGAERQLTAQLVRRVAVGLYGIEIADVESAPAPTMAPPASVASSIMVAGPAKIVAERSAATAPVDLTPQDGLRRGASVAGGPRPASIDARPSPEELPVLTDAIETPQKQEASASIQASRPDPLVPAPAAKRAAPAIQKAPALAPFATFAPAAPVAQAAPALRQTPPAPPMAPLPAARTTTPAAVPAETADEDDADLVHQTQTLRALSTAKSLDDISSSMAETLFGDADLDMLSAALASAGWSDDDEDSEDFLDDLARSATENSATMETPKGKFASFGSKPESLSLLEDPPTPAGGVDRKVASRV